VISADREPNNSFDQPESIGEGTISGAVYIGFFKDIDHYHVKIPDNGDIRFTLKLESNGLINLQVYEDDSNREDLSIEIDPSTSSEIITWERNEETDDLYVIISGLGQYSLEVEYADEVNVKGLLSWQTISLIVIFVIIALILIVITILFFKQINISDDLEKYEEMDYENGFPEAAIIEDLERLPGPDSIHEDITHPDHEELSRSIWE
jgi:hypothetical protein